MYSVVIPSGSMENLSKCVLHLHERRVIVIRETPFCFSRACNAGILAAASDDVVLLNDDAMLLTPDGFRNMAALAEAHPEFGLISASVDGDVCNPEQHYKSGVEYWRADRPMCAFICVYIPRRTIDRIGLLDERFTGFGYDDDDYCHRIAASGMRLAISGGCRVEHKSVPSLSRTGSMREHWQAGMALNRRLYEDKWKEPDTRPPEPGGALVGEGAAAQALVISDSLLRPKFSILICGLENRRNIAAGLVDSLRAQIRWLENPADVELLYLVDDGQLTVGAKRNQLLDQARGEYLAFIDDDDRVFGDYVRRMLAAMAHGPDCVGITGITSWDQSKQIKFFRNSLEFKVRKETSYYYFDRPSHLCAFRAELAKASRFPEKSYGEDRPWCEEVTQRLRTCVLIPDPVYYYDWRTERTATQISPAEAARRIDVSRRETTTQRGVQGHASNCQCNRCRLLRGALRANR